VRTRKSDWVKKNKKKKAEKGNRERERAWLSLSAAVVSPVSQLCLFHLQPWLIQVRLSLSLPLQTTLKDAPFCFLFFVVFLITL
jgi:hypothetical protein